MPVKSTTVTIRTEHELELAADELIIILKNAGYEIPQAATVYFAVPGGGDWSNTDVDIDATNPLRLKWSTVEEKNG